MNQKRARMAVAGIAALLFVGVVAAPAYAATASISDSNNTNTSWKHYATQRTLATSAPAFDPANSEADGSLLHQTQSIYVLNMKLRNANGADLTSSVQWNNVRTSKSLATGLARGTIFTVSVCCKSSSSSDTYWSGTLTY
ncbi:hypothetical protein [Cellulomonas phragmiteti]|uniref:Fibronectin type-III domain-containing protein n=1 Tax=Cellulomonas phragmiteti TaxID=478780 RepID=A0ABQ4DR68_9CELL|nr:hypothetical protein [Cellulomonas phragmiteti]GIG41829.1 hypothetical protein Cph01nite_35910 [Cellulomonas phragmiteti]